MIPDPVECASICVDTADCSFYTYFPDTYLCELFSACVSLSVCDVCITGYPGCDICSYEDTLQDTCDGCQPGWGYYSGHCYTVLDNKGGHYHGVTTCSQDCEDVGGTLASVHSREENSFVNNLIQSGNAEKTFLGMKQ